MKRCAFIVSVLALSLSTALSQGAGADSIRLRSAAGGSVWLLLPQTSTQQYRLLLPPSLGTSTNQLMWVNGTTGQISLLPPGSIGQILQVSSGGLSWVDPFSIVTINAWSLTGNSGTTPTTNFLGTTDNVGLALRTNNTERMRIAPNGNIGIGTTSPSHQLHIVAPGDPLRVEGLQTDNTLDQVLVANASGVVKLRSASTLASSTAWSLTGNSGTTPSSNFLGTTDNQPLAIRTNNSERVRITETGYVGIGTTAPGAKLSLGTDQANTKLAIYDGGSDQYGFGIQGSQFRIHLGNSGARFSFLNAPAGTEILTIMGSGNIGIGNTSPSARLHVSGGDVQAEGHLLLRNTDNTARELRLYEPSGAGAEYTAFRAQAQGSNITYTLPASLTPTTSVANALLQTDGSGNLSWVDPSSVVSSISWSLTGNSGTNPTNNFLGTTDNQPLVIRTNNTERVRVTETGRIGIGTLPNLNARIEAQTTNPSGAVEAVFGKGSSGVSLLSGWPTIGFNAYYDYANTQWRSLVAGWTGNISVDQNSGIMRFELPSGAASAANQPISHFIRMAITPSGGVGIGTLTPLQLLHVEGAAYIATQLGIGIANPTHALHISGNSALFSSANDFRLFISKNGAPNTASIIFQTNFSARAEMGLLSSTENFGLRVSNDGSSWINALTIDRTSGFTGIGTTGPSHRLHVSASSDPLRLEGLQTDNTLDQVLVANASGVVKLRSASTLASSIAWSLTGNSGTNPTNNFLGTTDNQPLVIRTNNSERLRVTATGDVGIGTTTPSQRLHVASSSDPLRLEGVQTDNSLDQILVINNNGVVKRRSLSSLAGTSIFVQKTSNQSVISSTTYQNDNALVYSANANQVFEFEACMFISGGNGGIKIRINIPTGASMKLYAELKKDDQHHWTYAKLTSSSDEINWGTIASNIGYARIRGIITMGSSGGNIQVQWAQNSSNSTATTVEAGSYLKITPIQ